MQVAIRKAGEVFVATTSLYRELAFSALKLERVVSFAQPENLASIRVLEKVGMLKVDSAESLTDAIEAAFKADLPTLIEINEHDPWLN